MNILEAVKALQEGHEVVSDYEGQPIFIDGLGTVRWDNGRAVAIRLSDKFSIVRKPVKKWRWVVRVKTDPARYAVSVTHHATDSDVNKNFGFFTAVQPVLETEIEE